MTALARTADQYASFPGSTSPVRAWDGHPVGAQDLQHPADPLAAGRLVGEGRGLGLAHGAGRSYGDVCLNPGGTLWMTGELDKFIGFDEKTGLLMCESGVRLGDIQRLAVPRGWMLPVSPGTQHVTVGGAIANDVHGKNHHRQGSFGDHVREVMLIRTDGECITCGPDRLPEWFGATVGGLGLTGLIMRATLQLVPSASPWFDVESLAFEDLDQFFELSDTTEPTWEHSVAWVNPTKGRRGRGLFKRANPAMNAQPGRAEEPDGRGFDVPFVPPFSLVNGLSARVFNAMYERFGRWRAGRALSHYSRFLYPLDGVGNWNRLYGKAGFFQYQCLLPRESGRDAVAALLDATAQSREPCALSVLKVFGERRSAGLLGFAGPGVTLALDFPDRGASTRALFERFDSIVLEAGGRLYPAKDARMPRAMFEAGYPRLAEFMPFRDPGISSGLSRRLMGS